MKKPKGRFRYWKEWAATLWRVGRKTLDRFGGRNVMLFAGGVSFFGMLAIFPGVAAAVSIYGIFASPEDVSALVAALAELAPPQARAAFFDQLNNLVTAPRSVLSIQGGIAVLVALYGAMRGMKAVLAGLNRISVASDVRGLLSFNLLAAGLTVLAILGAFAASVILITLPVLLRFVPLGEDVLRPILSNVGLWAAAAIFGAMVLLYRFVMAAGRVRWRASLIGAGAATLVWAIASAGFGYYVANIADFGATYGSIGAVVVFLMWIYVAAYALFFGAALATEAEIEIEARIARARALADAERQRSFILRGLKRLWTRVRFFR